MTALQKSGFIAALLALTLLGFVAGLSGFVGLFVTIDMPGADLSLLYQASCYGLMAISVIAPIAAWLTPSWRLWRVRLMIAAAPTLFAVAIYYLFFATAVLNPVQHVIRSP
jgi:hypothetical protein